MRKNLIKMKLSNKFSLKYLENKIQYLIIVLLSIMYGPILWHWYDGWLNKSIGIEHEYFSHGLIGIPFAFYLVWLNRQKWNDIPSKFKNEGLFFLALGGIFFLTGVPEFVNFSFPLILFGVCYFLKGKQGIKLCWFPFVLILFATPNSIPYLITPYSLGLQKLIATLSGFLLFHLGFDVAVNGIYITVNNRLVEVAPYCAGLKMLFTSLYVSLMILYWRDLIGDRTRSIMVLIGASIISVVGNVFRNAILAFFHGAEYDGLFTWFHDDWGGSLYSTFTLMIILWLVTYVEKMDLHRFKNTNSAEEETSDADFSFKF